MPTLITMLGLQVLQQQLPNDASWPGLHPALAVTLETHLSLL